MADGAAIQQLTLEGTTETVLPTGVSRRGPPPPGEVDRSQPWALSPNAKRPSQNPLRTMLGPGPEGTKCGDCRHLISVNGGARNYLKCDQRRITSGPGSDHRAGWLSCTLYEIEEA